MAKPPPPTQPSVKVVKSFAFQGSAKLFSNRYFFSGGTPADAGHWTTLSDAVVTAEKAIFGSQVQIVEVIAYAAGSEVPVHIKAYATNGTLSAVGPRSPGEAVALVRYATSARTSKNHPIYLFNYYHGVQQVSATVNDTVDSSQVTALQTYAALWTSTGFSDGTITVKRTGPFGHDATGYVVESNITHRDFR